MGIRMPNMYGVETIIALSRLSNDIPVIPMSGVRRLITREFDLESAILFGVKATLAKPSSLDDFRKAITETLSGK